jgi:hypothetical protein
MTLVQSPFEKELAEDGRILSSLAWLRQSGFTHRVADDRMLIYAADGSVCAYCYSADDVIGFARRQSPLRGAGPRVAPAVEDPGAVSPIVIRDLEETIRYLRQRWHTAIAERDEWEKRARAAEDEVETLRIAVASREPANGGDGEPMDGDAKFTALRRFLARELHPDSSPVSDDVRLMKSDLFKVVWAEIAKLDKA